MAGGAIYYRASNLMENRFFLLDGRFERNNAVSSKDKIFKESPQYLNFNENKIKMVKKKESDAQKLPDLRSTEICESGGGGAICLILSADSSRSPANIEISSSNFTENKAIIGGAMAVSTGIEVNWTANCDTKNSLTKSVLTRTLCRRLVLRNLLFERNEAEFAGGAITTSHLPRLYFTNNEKLDKFKTILELNLEASFKENKIQNGGYGPNVAGPALRLNIFSPKENKTTGVLIADQPSGSSNLLPRIDVELLDGLDQRVTFGFVVTVFAADISSKTEQSTTSVASGQVVAEIVNGLATFEFLTLTGPSGTYKLSFSVGDDVIQSIETKVTIRDCILGERYNSGGFICEKCPIGTFTVYKDVSKCEACLAHALCTGNASWIPDDGYWHSSPLSIIMLKCFNEEACTYKNRARILEKKRDARLEDFLHRFEESENLTFTNDEYPQCEDGYEGPLCGSCQLGYGQANGKRCLRCRSRSAAIAIILFIALWQLFLISFTIRSALVSIRDMNQLIMIQHQQPSQCITTIAVSGPSTLQSTNSRVDQLPADANSSFMMDSQPNVHIPDNLTPNEFEALYSSRFIAAQVNRPQATPAQQHSADFIIAAQHISETIKVRCL